MKEYLKALQELINKNGKAQVAVWLDVSNTGTLEAWFKRELIPAKYLDKITLLTKEKK